MLIQLLGFALRDRDEGGDGSSVCPTFPSHLSTFQAAAREFVFLPVIHSGYVDHAENILKPEWLNIFTVMFHGYFQLMRGNAAQDAPVDALIDALLLFCDCTDFEALSQAPGYILMVNLLGSCISNAFPPSDVLDDISSLFNQLRAVWNLEKLVRLNIGVKSIMPWSMDSIREGSLSRTCYF